MGSQSVAMRARTFPLFLGILTDFFRYVRGCCFISGFLVVLVGGFEGVCERKCWTLMYLSGGLLGAFLGGVEIWAGWCVTCLVR